VPLLFVDAGSHLLPPPGITFRDWLERGFGGRYPTLDDWNIHLSTVFTEVRLKQFLEIRGADATPSPLAIAVPALWKGLLYDRHALAIATEFARSFTAAEICGLSQAIARTGLQTEYRGRKVSMWCREVVEIAADGLKRIAFTNGYADESAYLDP